jgi:hypothetical protein
MVAKDSSESSRLIHYENAIKKYLDGYKTLEDQSKDKEELRERHYLIMLKTMIDMIETYTVGKRKNS